MSTHNWNHFAFVWVTIMIHCLGTMKTWNFFLFGITPLFTVQQHWKGNILFVWVTIIIHCPGIITRWYLAFQRYYHYSLSMHNWKVIYCLFCITSNIQCPCAINIIFSLFELPRLHTVYAEWKDDIYFVW